MIQKLCVFFQKKEKLVKKFYDTVTRFPKPEDTPPPPPPQVPVLQQLENLSLNDSRDVIRAQWLLRQYFKSFQKK